MKLNIKDILNSKNMSRYELAKRVGVTYPTITSIYNGESMSVKLEVLESLCRELDCTPNDIVFPEVESVKNNIEIEKLSVEFFNIVKLLSDNDITVLYDIFDNTTNKHEQIQRLEKYWNLINNKKTAIK